MRIVAQIELRDMLLPMLAYGNANSECQNILQLLKAQGIVLPGKSHGRRSLVGCTPWGLEELDTTE